MTQNNLNNTYPFFAAYKYGAGASKYPYYNHFLRSTALARNYCCFFFILESSIVTQIHSQMWKLCNACNLGDVRLILTKVCVYATMPCSYSIHFFKSLKVDSSFCCWSLASSTLSPLAAALPTCRHTYVLLKRALPPRACEKAENHGCCPCINNSHERNARKASII